MKKPVISDFNNSYDSIDFSDIFEPRINKLPNPNYYLNAINERFKFRINELESNLILQSRKSLLREYLIDLRKLSVDVVKLYEAIDCKIKPQNSNKFNIQMLKVKSSFSVLINYISPIQKNIEIDETDLAIRIKNYMIFHLKEAFSALDSEFSICLKKSPLNLEIKNVFKKLDKSIDIEEAKLLKNKKSKKEITKGIEDFIWFKVGLLLAKGIPQEIYEKHKNFTKITLELKFNKSVRPYFSETLQNTTTSDKNIYSNQKKLSAIYDYCIKNKIEMVKDFIDAYNISR